MPEDTNDVSPAEVEVSVPEEVAAPLEEAIQSEPEAEVDESASMEPRAISNDHSTSFSMSNDGGAVRETEFRTQ